MRAAAVHVAAFSTALPERGLMRKSVRRAPSDVPSVVPDSGNRKTRPAIPANSCASRGWLVTKTWRAGCAHCRVAGKPALTFSSHAEFVRNLGTVHASAGVPLLTDFVRHWKETRQRDPAVAAPPELAGILSALAPPPAASLSPGGEPRAAAAPALGLRRRGNALFVCRASAGESECDDRFNKPRCPSALLAARSFPRALHAQLPPRGTAVPDPVEQ